MVSVVVVHMWLGFVYFSVCGFAIGLQGLKFGMDNAFGKGKFPKVLLSISDLISAFSEQVLLKILWLY